VVVPGVTTRTKRDPAPSEGYRFRETSTGRTGKTRKVYCVSNFYQLKPFVVHDNSIVNARRALVERVLNVEGPDGLMPPPRPAAGAMAKLSSFRNLLGRYTGVIPRMPRQQFVDRYTGRRRTIYEKAMNEVEKYGLRPKDAMLSSFVKCEKVPLKTSDPVPRLIQPRGPNYNLEVGRHISHMEKPLYRAIGTIYGHPTVMKGHNAHGTAILLREKWDSYKDPVAVGLDAKRFDQHQSAEMLRWEHSVYLNASGPGDRKELKKLLEHQVRNRGVIRCPDGVIHYEVDGCRMSGDMNTAMGNCLVMCAVLHAFKEKTGLNFSLANNGDDCVIFLERRHLRDLNSLPNHFLEFGLQVEIEEPVDVFEKVVFCQTQPVYDGERWIMVRQPSVSMAKDAYCTLPMESPKVANGWMTAVGKCGMSMTGGIPVVQEYYAAYLRAGKGVEIGHTLHHESGFFHLGKGMDRHYRIPCSEARLSYWLAFGTTPTQQVLLEQTLATCEMSTTIVPPGKATPTFHKYHLDA